jgi:hypothetical protein
MNTPTESSIQDIYHVVENKYKYKTNFIIIRHLPILLLLLLILIISLIGCKDMYNNRYFTNYINKAIDLSTYSIFIVLFIYLASTRYEHILLRTALENYNNEEKINYLLNIIKHASEESGPSEV